MEPFKNIFNKHSLESLADSIIYQYPSFQKNQFLKSLLDDNWEAKELKQRIRAISQSLGVYLPKEYLHALEILKKVHHNFDGIFHFIFPDFVEVFGLEYYKESLEALKIFTSKSSSEFAIRAFLIQYLDTIEILKKWAKDENEHIRRLASEGSRPRLPWGVSLPIYKKDPTKVLEVLELLKDDTSKYVQKSVANNLNDISKDNPDMAIAVFKKWYGKSSTRNWIVKHGARTLLKSRNQEVLELFGISGEHIDVKDFTVDEKVQMGEYLDFSFCICSLKNLGKLRIEYKIGFVKQNGKKSYKVFKISERDVTQKQITIKKSHHFKYITTRKYYNGMHSLTIVVNAKEFATKEFSLDGVQ